MFYPYLKLTLPNMHSSHGDILQPRDGMNYQMTTVINASATVTLLEQRPEQNSGSEWDSNPQPLRCQCSALPTELSKPHVALIAQLGKHCTGIAEVVGSNPAQSLNFFQVSVLVVLRPHLH